MLKIQYITPPPTHNQHTTRTALCKQKQNVSDLYDYLHRNTPPSQINSSSSKYSSACFHEELQAKKSTTLAFKAVKRTPYGARIVSLVKRHGFLSSKNSQKNPDTVSLKADSFVSSFTSSILFYVTLFFVFALMLFLNLNTPLIADDYAYAFNGAQRVSSFAQIYDAMYRHYFEWGGRVFVHGLAMFFLWQPHVIFSIFNSIIFTLLILLLCAHASLISGNKITKWPLVLLAFVLVACFAPRFGQDVLWLTGACNYLWGNTLVLATLLPFTSRCQGHKVYDDSLIFVVFLTCCSFIAGWTTEGGGTTLVATQILLIGVVYIREKKICPWMILASIASMAGFLLMIIAPGNFKRLAVDGDGVHIVGSFFKILGSYFDPDFLLYPLVILLFLLQLPVFKPRKVRIALVLVSLVLLASTFCFVLSPSYTGRVQFLPVCIMTIMLMIPLYNLKTMTFKHKGFFACCGILLIVASLHISYVAIHDAKHINRFYKTVEHLITETQKDGKEFFNDEILIPASICYDPISHFGASYRLATLTSDPEGQINQLMAKFYGSEKKIRVVVEKYPLR